MATATKKAHEEVTVVLELTKDEANALFSLAGETADYCITSGIFRALKEVGGLDPHIYEPSESLPIFIMEKQ